MRSLLLRKTGKIKERDSYGIASEEVEKDENAGKMEEQIG